MRRLVDHAYLAPLALVALHVAALPLRVNHDCAQFLLAGRTLASGGRPYLDVVDTNPPLVMYLSTIPALLERVLPLHAITIFSILAIAAAAASAVALRRLLAHEVMGLSRAEAIMAAVLWSAATLSIDLDDQLGQRDHLFMLAFYPYALARWVRWEGGRIAAAPAIALGLAAGIAASFRPSLVVLVLGFEAALALVRRRARPLLAPEAVALAAAGGAYGLHFLLLPAEVRQAIFERWGPLVASAYSAYDSAPRFLLSRRAFVIAAATTAIPWVLAGPALPFASQGFWRLARALAPLTALAAGLYLLDRKDWTYRLHPTFGGATLLLALGLIAVLRRLDPGPADGSDPAALSARRAAWRAPAAATLAACLLLVAAWRPEVFSGVVSIDLRCDEVAVALERYSEPGEPVLFLATGVTPGHPPVLQTDRRLATRFLNLFPVALLTRSPDAAAERRFVEDLRGDFERSGARLVFVQREYDPGLPAGASVSSWLEARGALAGFLEGRRKAGRFGGMDLYVGAPAAGAPSPSGAR